MHTIKARNVNDAWFKGAFYLRAHGVEEESRNGPVLVAPGPVTTWYTHPTERVLFSAARNANPFFHLFESMWMLTGSDDATWLDRYVSDFSERFAEPDGRMHGAYGHRWRECLPAYSQESKTPDQLMVIAKILRDDPTSRQAVLQMWITQADLGTVVKDKPCNLIVAFRGRTNGSLDMTVFCRSNDIVWGAYGANAVHMSIMQEYVAALCGMTVGSYYQVSNNYHAYTAVMDKVSKRMQHPDTWFDAFEDLYSAIPPQQVAATPLFEHNRVEHIRDWLISWARDPSKIMTGGAPDMFGALLTPMSMTHDLVREEKWDDALEMSRQIEHSDWRHAAEVWILRRKNPPRIRRR